MSPELRIGDDVAWVALAHDPGSSEGWRVTADWDDVFSAGFGAYLDLDEVAAFTDALRAGLESGGSFRLPVTEARSNPLELQSVPVGDGFAFHVRLTPKGHDTGVHLDLEIDPMDRAELRTRIEDFRRFLG
ncbi:hypothetical protein [Streptomyces vilmorinianum]|uniref:hypothetical protein n=1 Tax=Streptomyces vilmorinianum TaxID=3051092 RepID=UPI0010FB0E3A|nr:hypothetical protein [Streptomyces vilmorinianum]